MLKYFYELDIEQLVGKVILLDVDGTITHDDSNEIRADTVLQIKKLRGRNTIYLCSNKKDKNRVFELAKTLGIIPLISPHKKPSRRILEQINIPNNSLVIIGDKWLTDGLLAKRVGAMFIKVRRLIDYKESLYVNIINFLDDLAYKTRNFLQQATITKDHTDEHKIDVARTYSSVFVFATICLAVVLSFFLAPNYQGLWSDHDIILSPLFHQIDNSILPHDPFSFYKTYAEKSIYLDMYEFLYRIHADIYFWLFAVVLLSRFIIAASVYIISFHITQDKLVSILMPFITLTGFYSSISNYEPIALAFGLLATALFLKGKLAISGSFLVLTFLVHPITGANFLILFFLHICWDKKHFKKNTIILVLILSALGVYYYFNGGGGFLKVMTSETELFLKNEMPAFFVSMRYYSAFVNYVGMMLLGLILLMYSKKLNYLVLFILAYPIFLILQFLSADVFLLENLAMLQLDRNVYFLKFPIFLSLLYLAVKNGHSRLENSVFITMIFWTFLQIPMTFSDIPIILFVPLLVFLLSSHVIFAKPETGNVVFVRIKKFMCNFIKPRYILPFMFLAYIVFTIFLFTKYQENVFSVLHLLIIFLCVLAVSYYKQFSEKERVCVFFSFWLIFNVFNYGVKVPVIYPHVSITWRETCDWIKTNTPKDAIFLLMESQKKRLSVNIRMLCLREPFFIARETAFRYNLSTIPDWQRRKHLTETRNIEAVKKEYDVHYILADHPLNKKLLFSNSNYYVYAL